MKKILPGTSSKRKSSNPIHSYFSKVKEPKLNTSSNPDSSSQPSTSAESDRVQSIPQSEIPTTDITTTNVALHTSELTTNTNASCSSEHLSSADHAPSFPLEVYDIGLYVGKQVDKFTKFNLIKNHWQPPKDYAFPFSLHNKGGKEVKRFLGRNHLESKHWLELSDQHKGLFCKYCVLFSQEYSGHNKGVRLQSFVTKPVTSFAKLLGKDGVLESHESNTYHQNSVEAGKNFVKSYMSPNKAVVNKVNTQRLKQIAENRERLRPIIESIIFLGRQNIPLRGHRDDGQLLIQEDVSLVNEGNFRELLRLRVAAGDECLKKHLDSSSSRATYIGKNTQNSLIECCGQEIRCEIVRRVHEAGCYSIIFDETTDLSHTEQLSLTLRYIYNGQVREDFIAFIDAYESLQEELPDDSAEPKITGKMLGKIVLKLVSQLSLDIKKCVGVGTDSCSVMSSEIKGAVTEILNLKEASHAVRCPCLNHGLNNSLSKSNNVQCVRNLVGTIKAVVEFFSASAKRNLILKNALKERNKDDEEFKGTQLQGLCETRWVERHDSVINFKKALPYIVEALDVISGWSDLTTSSKANSIRKSLCDVQFVCSLIALISVLKYTLPLSRMLQAPNLDLKKASDLILDTLSVLENKRKECDFIFSKVFCKVQELCSVLDIDIKVPRIAGRQTNRPNYSTSTPEEYFKMSIYIPLLDNIINDLRSRFPKDTLECFGMQMLIPSNAIKKPNSQKDKTKEKDQLLALVEKFETILHLDKRSPVLAEYDLWREKWLREQCDKEEDKELPGTALDAMEACDKDIYPSVYALLKIFSTLPVSVASAERSFSTLRRLKTWLRTRMSEERLCGLCLLHTHREIKVQVEKVIERFANSGNRRLDFVI